MHQWASLTVARYTDPVPDAHILMHPKPEQSGRDKTFLPRVEVEPGGGNPLFGTLAATVSMAGWAAVLWVVVSLFTFFLYGRWYVPLVADLVQLTGLSMNQQGIQGIRQVRADLAKVEKRESPRFPFSSAVMIENYQAKTCHDGRMVDYSRLGMQFEAGVAPDVGSEIFIGIDKSPYSTVHDVFRATVVWLQECQQKESYYPYSVGVKFY